MRLFQPGLSSTRVDFQPGLKKERCLHEKWREHVTTGAWGESLAGLYTSIFPPHQIMRTHATRGIEGCVAGSKIVYFTRGFHFNPG